MRAVLTANGYALTLDAPNNQVFVTLPNDKMKELSNVIEFSFGEAPDPDHTVVRFASSWATQETDVDMLGEVLRRK